MLVRDARRVQGVSSSDWFHDVIDEGKKNKSGRRRRPDKWGASVARRPPGRADSRYLRSESSRSHTVIVGIFRFGPVTAVPCRAKTIPLLRASSLFRPHESPFPKDVTSRKTGGIWWRRRVLPPGPLRLFRTAFIAIVGHADRPNIGAQ